MILSILFCTSSNFYLGEPCSLFVYGVKAPANRNVRRLTEYRMLSFFSVAARLIPLSGQCVQIPSHSWLVYLLLANAAHQAFTDNHPEHHTPTGFAMRHRLELFLTLKFRSPLFDLTQEGSNDGIFDCYAHCVQHVAIKIS